LKFLAFLQLLRNQFQFFKLTTLCCWFLLFFLLWTLNQFRRFAIDKTRLTINLHKCVICFISWEYRFFRES